MNKNKKYSTLSDLATYHTIIMDGERLGGVKFVSIKTGLDDKDMVTEVTLKLAIKAGSLKADGTTIEFETIRGKKNGKNN